MPLLLSALFIRIVCHPAQLLRIATCKADAPVHAVLTEFSARTATCHTFGTGAGVLVRGRGGLNAADSPHEAEQTNRSAGHRVAAPSAPPYVASRKQRGRHAGGAPAQRRREGDIQRGATAGALQGARPAHRGRLPRQAAPLRHGSHGRVHVCDRPGAASAARARGREPGLHSRFVVRRRNNVQRRGQARGALCLSTLAARGVAGLCCGLQARLCAHQRQPVQRPAEAPGGHRAQPRRPCR